VARLPLKEGAAVSPGQPIVIIQSREETSA
jgi:hypothetical protein